MTFSDMLSVLGVFSSVSNLCDKFNCVYFKCIISVIYVGGHKTLTISEEAYEKLVKTKRSGESFTETILRLTRGRGSILRHAGSWGNLDDAEVERVFKGIREAWERGWCIGSS